MVTIFVLLSIIFTWLSPLGGWKQEFLCLLQVTLFSQHYVFIIGTLLIQEHSECKSGIYPRGYRYALSPYIY